MAQDGAAVPRVGANLVAPGVAPPPPPTLAASVGAVSRVGVTPSSRVVVKKTFLEVVDHHGGGEGYEEGGVGPEGMSVRRACSDPTLYDTGAPEDAQEEMLARRAAARATDIIDDDFQITGLSDDDFDDEVASPSCMRTPIRKSRISDTETEPDDSAQKSLQSFACYSHLSTPPSEESPPSDRYAEQAIAREAPSSDAVPAVNPEFISGMSHTVVPGACAGACGADGGNPVPGHEMAGCPGAGGAGGAAGAGPSGTNAGTGEQANNRLGQLISENQRLAMENELLRANYMLAMEIERLGKMVQGHQNQAAMADISRISALVNPSSGGMGSLSSGLPSNTNVLQAPVPTPPMAVAPGRSLAPPGPLNSGMPGGFSAAVGGGPCGGVVSYDAAGSAASGCGGSNRSNKVRRNRGTKADGRPMPGEMGGGVDMGSVDLGFHDREEHCLPGSVGMPHGGSTARLGEATTVMLRNVPNNYTRGMVLEMIDREGFQGMYNFFYLPIDFNSHACLGYAFVNLCSPEFVASFWSTFDGYRKWILPSRKICRVCWSGPHQGFEDHVSRYRNSPVMHDSVPDDFKPMLFEAGTRIAFPPPTKIPRAPRVRQREATTMKDHSGGASRVPMVGGGRRSHHGCAM